MEEVLKPNELDMLVFLVTNELPKGLAVCVDF
jgi:hypothetical protein